MELRLAACCVHLPLHGPTLTWLLLVCSVPWLGLVGLKLSLSLIDAGCSGCKRIESRSSSRQTRPHCGPPSTPASPSSPALTTENAALCFLPLFGLVRFITELVHFALRHGSLPLTFTLHPPPPFFSSPYPRDTHPISMRGKEDHPNN